MLLIFGNVQNDMTPTGSFTVVAPAAVAAAQHVTNPMVVHVGRLMTRLIPFLVILGM